MSPPLSPRGREQGTKPQGTGLWGRRARGSAPAARSLGGAVGVLPGGGGLAASRGPGPRVGVTYRGQREAVVQEVGVPSPGLAEAVFVGRGQPSRQRRVGRPPSGVFSAETDVGPSTTRASIWEEPEWEYLFKEQKEMRIFCWGFSFF